MKRKRRNPINQNYIIGAIVIGTGLYLITRNSNAAVIPEPVNTPAVATPPTLLTLLRTNKTARQIFNVQALAWSLGMSNDTLDGRFGSKTQLIINRAEDILAEPRTTGFTPFSLFAVKRAGEATGANLRMRVLPMYLPSDVVQLLNREALAVDPSATLIQARAMASSSVPSSLVPA